MQVRIKLTPTRFYSTTREGALFRVQQGMNFVQSSEVGYGLQRLTRNDERVRVYSIQKIRAKSVETGKIKKEFYEGFPVKVKEKYKVRYTQVEVIYYDIPVALLKILGKKVEQGKKTWGFV